MAYTTTNFLDVLGVGVTAGRGFWSGDAATATSAPIAIVSHRLWARLFGDEPWAAGRTLDIGTVGTHRSIEIVGVLPSQVETPGLSDADPESIDLFAASTEGPRPGGSASRRVYDRRLIARLHNGVTLAQAEERLTSILRKIDIDNPIFGNRVRTASVVSLQEQWLGRSRGLLWLLAAAAGLVVLVALSNLAGLLAIIATRRTRERAIRSALGANSAQLRWAWLTELLPLTLPASILGSGLATLLVNIFRALAPSELPRLANVHVDVTGWLLATGTVFLILGVSGIAGLPSPAGQAWSPLQAHATTATPRRRRWLTHAVVSIQMAVVLALLAAAGLVTSTLWRMLNQPLGFNPDGVAIARIVPTQPHFRDAARYQQIMNDMRRAVASLPGTRTVALAFDPPLSTQSSRMRAGFTHRAAAFVSTKFITDGFVSAMGAQLIAGRDFQPADFTGPPVVLVNERFAVEYFGGVQAALGQSFEFGPQHHIVGVISDMREGALTSALTPILYPLLVTELRPVGAFHLVSREHTGGTGYLREIENALRSVDPSAHVSASWLADRRRVQTASARTQTFVLVTLAALTLLLALLGTYSTVRQLVDERRRELAIRSALGATPHSLISLTLRGTAGAVFVGVGLGAVLSAVVSSVTRQFLFNTSPFDPVIWSGAGLLMVGAAVSAAWLPAREAGQANPVAALK